MPWKEISAETRIRSLGGDPLEVREKQRLMEIIKRARKAKRLSQKELAKKMGVTQGRVAQVESGIGTTNVSFEVLFGILKILGYECRIVAKKAS